MCYLLLFLPGLTSLTSYVSSGITFWINHLLSNPHLRVSIWGQVCLVWKHLGMPSPGRDPVCTVTWSSVWSPTLSERLLLVASMWGSVCGSRKHENRYMGANKGILLGNLVVSLCPAPTCPQTILMEWMIHLPSLSGRERIPRFSGGHGVWEPRLCQLHCKLWLQNKPPQTQGLETSTVFILLTDLQLPQGLRGAHLCSRGVSRRTLEARAGTVITCAGKVTERWCSRRPPGAITAVWTCPRGAPLSGMGF